MGTWLNDPNMHHNVSFFEKQYAEMSIYLKKNAV